jgi:oxygen-independent coproporphyrinogen-3 oxidase
MNSWTSFSSAKPPDVRGLYLHVPFCDGKCPYCAFYSVRYEPALAEAYLDALEREAALYPGLRPRTVYVGGGTPSLLPASQLKRLLAIVRGLLGHATPEEWTVEVNPGTAGTDTFRILADAGVTRLSLGAQSFDDRSLRRLGRRHTVRDTLAAIEQARAAGFRNVGLDLIAAVPGISGRAWTETLRRAADLAPEHVSVYALTAEEGSRLAGQIQAGAERLADEDTELRALHAAERTLRPYGFVRYEISNYAQPGFACRHNLSCWRGEDYVGLGPGASSRIELRRWTNRPDLDAWLRDLRTGRPPPAESDPLTPELDITERLIFGLRMNEGVSAGLAAGRESILAALRRQGLVRLERGRWRLTARGRDLADYVAVELIP